MGDDLFLCMASCQNANSTGTLVGNDSYDIECITQCSQLHAKLYEHTAEKYIFILKKNIHSENRILDSFMGIRKIYTLYSVRLFGNFISWD